MVIEVTAPRVVLIDPERPDPACSILGFLPVVLEPGLLPLFWIFYFKPLPSEVRSRKLPCRPGNFRP